MRIASLIVGAWLTTFGRLAAQETLVQRADTLPPPGVEESDFSFANGGVTLAGTITIPRGRTGPVPVAVIIAGSGPTDRNGNSHLGPGLVYRNNSLSQLAWRLAELGIASLRYDKRVLPPRLGRSIRPVRTLLLNTRNTLSSTTSPGMPRPGPVRWIAIRGFLLWCCWGTARVPASRSVPPRRSTGSRSRTTSRVGSDFFLRPALPA